MTEHPTSTKAQDCQPHVTPVGLKLEELRDPATYTQKIRRTVPLLLEFLDSDASLEAKAARLRATYLAGPRPLRRLPRDCWARLFRLFAPLPAEASPSSSATMWRASTAEFARGLSWTPDRRVASLFVSGWHSTAANVLHSCEVHPEWVLACLTPVEYVVDIPAHASITAHPSDGERP